MKNIGICSACHKLPPFSARSQDTTKENAMLMLLTRPTDIDIDMMLTKEKSTAGNPSNKLASYLHHLFFLIASNYKTGING